jgi:SEC-C motif domain protein
MPRPPSVTPAPPASSAPCPCGLAASYGECCGLLHRGQGTAATAERLMRSRYSAFVARDAGYLLRTWAAATHPPSVVFTEGLRWTGLEVLGTRGGTAFHETGTVDFRARFRYRGRDGEQRENSRFVREAGRWVYVAGAAD